MQEQTKAPMSTKASLFKRARRSIRERFSLRNDKADDHVTDNNIRSGVKLNGTNLWSLICAIFLASIGLNVNSTAVIIGAMLISPLMGPIMGIGYGIGIYDFPLIKRSLKNLGIATFVSLLTSTLYFLISPLGQAQSELLARTSPTIWDVLIAFFGGLVGVIGATRKDRTNVIPGVAIATALMPPLCTAGFGLAHGNLNFFLGALYLFSINCVFIAFSTVLVVWIIRPPHANQADEITQRHVKRSVFFVVALTLAPSVYLAYHLVQSEVFNNRAREFISKELVFTQTVVTDSNIDAASKNIDVTIVGALVNQSILSDIEKKLPQYGLPLAKLRIQQGGNERIDVSNLRSSILNDANKEARHIASEKDKVIKALQTKLEQQTQAQQQQKINDRSDLASEIHAQNLDVKEIFLSEADGWDASERTTNGKWQIVLIYTAKPVSKQEQQRLQRWLETRLKTNRVHFVFQIAHK